MILLRICSSRSTRYDWPVSMHWLARLTIKWLPEDGKLKYNGISYKRSTKSHSYVHNKFALSMPLGENVKADIWLIRLMWEKCMHRFLVGNSKDRSCSRSNVTLKRDWERESVFYLWSASYSFCQIVWLYCLLACLIGTCMLINRNCRYPKMWWLPS